MRSDKTGINGFGRKSRRAMDVGFGCSIKIEKVTVE